MQNRTYSEIDEELLNQLMKIEPSTFWELDYLPCKVLMKNGKTVESVYICEARMYIKTWGVWPKEDKGKRSILIQDVAKIEESDMRIPAKFANQVYQAGESGMGYYIFTLMLNDGRKLPYLTGNAMDFVNFPPGVKPEMIINILPHQGREFFQKSNGELYTQGAKYYWCLYLNPQN